MRTRIRRMVSSAQQRAKKQGIPFDLKVKDIEIPEVCPVLFTPFSFEGPLCGASPTLDRFIPEEGYVPGNVCVISALANRIKSNATWQQVRAVADWMEEQAAQCR